MKKLNEGSSVGSRIGKQAVLSIIAIIATLNLTGCSYTQGAYERGVPNYNLAAILDLPVGYSYDDLIANHDEPTARQDFSDNYVVAQYCNPVPTRKFNFAEAKIAVLVFKNSALERTANYLVKKGERGSFNHCKIVTREIIEAGSGQFFSKCGSWNNLNPMSGRAIWERANCDSGDLVPLVRQSFD